jgi:hypothetical protein
MTETGVFIAGSIVTIIVFTGALMYAVFTLGPFDGKDSSSVAPAPTPPDS